MNFLSLLGSVGQRRSDTPEVRLQKKFLVYLGASMSMGGLMWGTLCVWQNLWLASLIPYGYTLATVLNFVFFAYAKNFGVARFFQVLISLLLPFLFQFSLGSFASTGAVMLWALISLVAAFTFEELRHTLYWIGLYVGLTVALGINDVQPSTALVTTPATRILFFVTNISVISVIVAGLSYYFLKSRSQTLGELAAAKRETDLLLATVDEGLFIISKGQNGYALGVEQSAAIRDIFEIEKLPAVTVAAALSPYLTPAKARELDNYLKLIASPTVKKAMIQSLNPLELIHASVGNPPQEKYLQFGFWPVAAGRQDQYLVRVKDVTKATLLQQQLAENEKKNEEHTKMLLSVLHVGPGLLGDFLAGVREELAVITGILQSDRSVGDAVRDIEQLLRSAHSIKGNASLLDLKILASAAHELEDSLSAIRSKETPEWTDFIPLAQQVSDLTDIVNGLEDLLGRLQSFRSESGGQAESAISAIPQNITSLVERAAADYGKKVATDFSAFNPAAVPERYAYLLRDIGVQLARNSVAHGIESPGEREASGKDVTGKISVSLSRADSECVFVMRDDGKSFDFRAIRERAASANIADMDSTAVWNQKKLIRLMFAPGFSTASAIDMTAGRGMGLDIVRQRLKTAGGDLRINFKPGQYTEFAIRLPLKPGE